MGSPFAAIHRSLRVRSKIPAGVWLSNYVAKTIVVRNADVQGMRTGISSPFYQEVRSSGTGTRRWFGLPSRAAISETTSASLLRPRTVRAAEAGAAIKKAVVRDSVFEPLNVPVDPLNPPAAISMNYRMAPNDPDPRDPIAVYNFNKKPGDNFKVYYSLEAPQSVAPCHDTRSGIGGWVCK